MSVKCYLLTLNVLIYKYYHPTSFRSGMPCTRCVIILHIFDVGHCIEFENKKYEEFDYDEEYFFKIPIFTTCWSFITKK